MCYSCTHMYVVHVIHVVLACQSPSSGLGLGRWLPLVTQYRWLTLHTQFHCGFPETAGLKESPHVHVCTVYIFNPCGPGKHFTTLYCLFGLEGLSHGEAVD